MKPAKFDTFPRPAFRVYRTAHGVAVERVAVHGVDRLSGSAQCSLAAPGYGLKNAVGFAELASSERRAVALVARLLMPAAPEPAAPFAEQCAALRERRTAHFLFSLPSKTVSEPRPACNRTGEERPALAGTVARVKLPGLRPLSRPTRAGSAGQSAALPVAGRAGA